MDEARSLQYSINVTADTGQAEANIRNVTSSLGNLQGSGSRITIDADSSGAESSIRSVTSGLGGVQTQASSVGAAFRSSFLEGIDSGNSFGSSLKAGVGGAFTYVVGKANEFASNVTSTAQSIKNGFAHPIETIKSGLGNALQSAKDRFIDLARGADQAADKTDEVDDAAGDARKSVSEMGDAAEESGGKFEKLGGVLKGVGATVAAFSAAAAAGAVALGKEVVSSFADYEQLVGGVDTLFGDASKTVQNFAANAFQTSGMAANDYMELVTSFSASLIQSLGGDTAAAAVAADTAITDMADNSNKMGTSLESIQNAYRGFSMQNYTMLDNLKLGYGGTQDEMERLLSDAEKLSGVKYDISSFADITEAIHVVQTEMGITGTTAKEAAETISGSWSSTKSAVQNLITGLGRSDADLGMLVGNVVENFGNVVDNVVPVIENMVNQMPAVMDALIPAIGEMLPKLLGVVEKLFGEVLNTLLILVPEIIPVVVSAITTIAETIVANLPLIIDAGLELVGGLFGGIVDALPMLAEAAVTIVSTLATNLGESLPTIIPTVIEAIGTVVTTLLDNLPLLLDAGMQLLMGLAQGLVDALPMFIEMLPTIITGILDFITENLPTILEQGAAILMTLAEGILTALPMLIEQLPSIITGIVNFVAENLPLIVETGISILIQLAGGIIQAIPQLVAQLPAIISAIVGGIGALMGSIVEVGKNIVTGIWDGICAAASWLKEKVTGFFSGIVGGVKDFLGIHSPSRVFADIGDNMALGVGEGFGKTIDGVTKDIEKSMPTDITLPGIEVPDPDLPTGGAGAIVPNVAYTVSPIVEDVVTPSVSDVTYGVNPVVGDFNPPDTTAADYPGGGGEPAPGSDDPETSGGGSPAPFAPVIYITVEGSADEGAIENMRTSLRDTVRELFDEFREEELERQTLKHQYAF